KLLEVPMKYSLYLSALAFILSACGVNENVLDQRSSNMASIMPGVETEANDSDALPFAKEPALDHEGPITFHTSIGPFLNKYCVACHAAPTASNANIGLRL